MKTKTMKTTILSLMMALMMIFAITGIAVMTASAADGDTFVTVGDFQVKGDSEGYTFEGDTLRFTKEGAYTVKNVNPSVATSQRIEIQANIELTLAGVNIRRGDSSPMELYADATVILAEDTENSLTATYWFIAGLQSGEYALTIDGKGALTAQGGLYAAGIGGAYDYGANQGNVKSITILGGTVTATGGSYGAGIGGGYHGSVTSITISGGTVTATGGDKGAGIGGGNISTVQNITISGGTVTATGGDNGAGIGGGDSASNTGKLISGENGGAIVQASSINSNRDEFVNYIEKNGSSYKVHGNVTLRMDLTIGEDDTLNIPEGATLTIPEGVTLTVNGTLSNLGKIICNNHTYNESGFCTLCGFSKPTVGNDGIYEISNQWHLLWFAEQVNGGKTDIKGKLMGDIDLTGIAYTPIGTEANPYVGTFDGQGYSIRNMIIDNTAEYQGLFGVVNAGVVIKNIVIDASCSIKGGDYTAAIVGGSVLNASGEVTIENCVSYANVSGGQHTSGIFGCNTGDDATVIIRNCANLGNITGGKNCGTIAGYLGTNTVGTLESCWNVGKLTAESGDSFAHFDKANIINCYNLDTLTASTKEGVSTFTAEELKNGALAYKLGGNWGQTIGTDEKPVLGGAKVYYGYTDCQDTTAKYSNTELKATQPEHNYDNGVCTVCGGFLPAVENDGIYEISNQWHLLWFAEQVNGGNTAINGKLMDDIDLTGIAYTPIGTEANPYVGTFDGQGYSIKHMVIDSTESYQGLFGVVDAGVVIKNIVIDASCSIKGGNYTAALVGGSKRYANGTVTVEGCINYADVSGGQHTGGIFGCNTGDDATIIIRNCANLGNITGGKNCGTIAGYLGTNTVGTLESCWNVGKLTAESGDSFAHFDKANIINCYNLDTLTASTKEGVSTFTAEELANGALAYKLGAAWGQTIDTNESPVLGGARVYASQYCDGTVLGYSNTESDTIHFENEYGYCELCQVKITGASLTLGSDLATNYYVFLADEYANAVMYFTMENGKTAEVKGEYDEASGYYVFRFDKLPPQTMGDTIDAVLMLDGEILDEMKGYSIKAYAEALLGDEASTDELKRLVSDMLHYGSAAQVYKNYKSDALVNDVEGILEATMPDIGLTDMSIDQSASETIGFTSVGVWFDYNNRLYVKLSTIENVKLTVNGEEVELTDTTYMTDGILATGFDTVYTFQLYEGETPVQTLTYSIRSYVLAMQNSQNANMTALANALYAYGKSAEAYAVTVATSAA